MVGLAKRGGRRKGSPNTRTKEMFDRVEAVVNALQRNMESDLKALKPVERIKLWTELQEYIRPKLARIEQTGSVELKATINQIVVSLGDHNANLGK